jgi:hypothetical protein
MATREDANLMMQIMQWATTAGMMGATVGLIAAQFDPDTASATDKDVFAIPMMGETIGTFGKQGVLDAGLVHELWAPAMLWSRVRPAVVRHREQFGEPRLWEDFEALTTGGL